MLIVEIPVQVDDIVVVGTGISISTVPVCPGVAGTVMVVVPFPVHVLVKVVVGTGR